MEGSNPITNHPAVLQIIESPVLYDLFTDIFRGVHPVTFDYKWLRGMHQGGNTGCHMDRVYMNRGSSELLTCWIPFDNLTFDMSVLAVLEGSHRMDRAADDTFTKLQHTYADLDVDRDKLRGTGWFTEDPMEFYHFNDKRQENESTEQAQSNSKPIWKAAGNIQLDRIAVAVSYWESVQSSNEICSLICVFSFLCWRHSHLYHANHSHVLGQPNE